MQKKNSVIKNYILSPEKHFLQEKFSERVIEISLYHLRAAQNTDEICLFLLRK